MIPPEILGKEVSSLADTSQDLSKDQLEALASLAHNAAFDIFTRVVKGRVECAEQQLLNPDLTDALLLQSARMYQVWKQVLADALSLPEEAKNALQLNRGDEEPGELNG